MNYNDDNKFRVIKANKISSGSRSRRASNLNKNNIVFD